MVLIHRCLLDFGPPNAGLPFPDFSFLKSRKSSDILALGCLEKSCVGGNGHSREIRWAFTPKMTGFLRGIVQLPGWLVSETVAPGYWEPPTPAQLSPESSARQDHTICVWSPYSGPSSNKLDIDMGTPNSSLIIGSEHPGPCPEVPGALANVRVLLPAQRHPFAWRATVTTKGMADRGFALLGLAPA